MGRKNLREKRRAEIVAAFGRVLANHGYAGATIQAVAIESDMAPGLLHHYFTNKDEMLHELLSHLIKGFKGRLSKTQSPSPLDSYLRAALERGEGSDPQAARCWVGLFAEAMRDATLLAKIRRYLEGEISLLVDKSGGKLNIEESSAILAYVLGCLVFGAFAPRKAEGFAYRGARKMLELLT